MLEISFTGRGGQGVVIASQMLGFAFFKAGMYPQCYSIFGGERRGAPLTSFLRVDEKKILLKCEIKFPNEIICFDDSLLDPQAVKANLRPGGSLLINTQKGPEAFAMLREFTLGIVDAAAVAGKAKISPYFNTVMVGAYAGFTGRLQAEQVRQAVKEMAPTKPDLNAEAACLAFDQVTIISPGGSHV